MRDVAAATRDPSSHGPRTPSPAERSRSSDTRRILPDLDGRPHAELDDRCGQLPSSATSRTRGSSARIGGSAGQPEEHEDRTAEADHLLIVQPADAFELGARRRRDLVHPQAARLSQSVHSSGSMRSRNSCATVGSVVKAPIVTESVASISGCWDNKASERRGDRIVRCSPNLTAALSQMLGDDR